MYNIQYFMLNGNSCCSKCMLHCFIVGVFSLFPCVVQNVETYVSTKLVINARTPERIFAPIEIYFAKCCGPDSPPST